MVRCRRAVAALTLGPEQTILRAARLCLCDTRRGIGGRQDSRARMPMGVDEKEFVAHLCTLSQKVLSLVREPTLGMKRSVPYRRIGVTSDVANPWHREGAEASDQCKSPLGQRHVAREVCRCGQGGGEPVP